MNAWCYVTAAIFFFIYVTIKDKSANSTCSCLYCRYINRYLIDYPIYNNICRSSCNAFPSCINSIFKNQFYSVITRFCSFINITVNIIITCVYSIFIDTVSRNGFPTCVSIKLFTSNCRTKIVTIIRNAPVICIRRFSYDSNSCRFFCGPNKTWNKS